MAPKDTTALLSQYKPDKDQKIMNQVIYPKRPANNGDLNDRSRKLIKKCFSNLRSNLNVLVIGAKESGKSSLINSLNMALTQEWEDRARYCPGRKHIIDQCVMYRHQCARKSNQSKVVFWDARGFEDIHNEEHAVLILRYVLEGRIPPKCIPCVLLMTKDLVKKRYQRICTLERRIDLILNVSSLDVEPQTRLMGFIQQAIDTSKIGSVKKIPILSVATKSDILSDKQMEEKLSRLHEYDLKRFVEEQRLNSQPNYRKRHLTAPDSISSTKLIVNYCCELEPWSDESADPASVLPSITLDAKLLALWRDIVSLTAEEDLREVRPKLPSSTPPSPTKPMFRCLPFRLTYTRLRSKSF